MPTDDDARRLQTLLRQLTVVTGRDLSSLWRDYATHSDFATILQAALPDLMAPHTRAAALLTAQWYDELAPDLDYTATPIADISADRITGSAAWALAQPGHETSLQRMTGAAQRMVFDASRQTVVTNIAAENDIGPDAPEVREPGTLWARQASPTACSFCRMLATRAAVYRSKQSAMRVTGRSTQLTHADQKMIFAGFDTAENLLHRREASTTYHRGKRKGQQRIKTLRGNRSRGQQYHDHCSCVAIPVRAGSTYEPPDYAADWEDDYIAAKRAARAAGETRGKHGAIDETAVLRHMDHIERDRKNGITAAPIEMVDTSN